VKKISSNGSYSHILSPSSNVGKNFMPRLGALLDASPLSDIVEVVNENTFKRPIYAGSAIATVQMEDPVKLILTRATGFDKAATEGGSASTEAITLSDDDSNSGLSSFVSENVSQSERPELTSASIVISGGRGMKNCKTSPLSLRLSLSLSV
jgi:electron transfer flavoprotein alpha subunit